MIELAFIFENIELPSDGDHVMHIAHHAGFTRAEINQRLLPAVEDQLITGLNASSAARGT